MSPKDSAQNTKLKVVEIGKNIRFRTHVSLYS
jgi:hypothetical protein